MSFWTINSIVLLLNILPPLHIIITSKKKKKKGCITAEISISEFFTQNWLLVIPSGYLNVQYKFLQKLNNIKQPQETLWGSQNDFSRLHYFLVNRKWYLIHVNLRIWGFKKLFLHELRCTGWFKIQHKLPISSSHVMPASPHSFS